MPAELYRTEKAAAGAEGEEAGELLAKPPAYDVIVGFWIPADVGAAIAIPGGVPVDQLHLTLAYLGKIAELPKDGARLAVEAVAAYAESATPFHGVISGIGRFNASSTSDGMDVFYASVDAPGLLEFRQGLVDALKAAGLPVSEKHSFTPHITLAYIAADSDIPVQRIPTQQMEFTGVTVAVGADEHYIAPIGPSVVAGEPVEKALGAAEEEAFQMVIPVTKADAVEQLVTGIVLQPETVDAHGDIYSAEVIKEAAHNFLAEYNRVTKLGYQHQDFTRNFKLVESYIAPTPMVLNGRAIKQGAWVMTVKILDPFIWEKVEKGEITGFSIGGIARAQRLA